MRERPLEHLITVLELEIVLEKLEVIRKRKTGVDPLRVFFFALVVAVVAIRFYTFFSGH